MNWNTTLLSTSSSNGANTFNFTPTESNVRITLSASSSFSLNDISLIGELHDTIIKGGYVMSNGYRYGVNGMERDDKVKGVGNSYNYKKRMYDPRVGKFLSIDPLTEKFPFYSPYQFAGNKPTIAIDLDGKEESITIMDPHLSVDVYNAVNSGDVQRATYIALKSVDKGGGKIKYNGDFEGLRVNVHVQDDLIQNAFSMKKIQKPKEDGSYWDSFLNLFKGNESGGTSDRGGIMFTSSMGQNRESKALDPSKVDGPINIDMLLSTLGAANSAASGGAETQIFKMISGWIQNYENGNAIREQIDKVVVGKDNESKSSSTKPRSNKKYWQRSPYYDGWGHTNPYASPLSCSCTAGLFY